MAEQTADNLDCQMRAAHEMNTLAMQMLECIITVQGWNCDAGVLWVYHCGQTLEVISPMLLPTGNTAVSLIIKGAKHIQDSQGGTRTELSCVLRKA